MELPRRNIQAQKRVKRSDPRIVKCEALGEPEESRTRSFICPAALFVNVTARIAPPGTPFSTRDERCDR